MKKSKCKNCPRPILSVTDGFDRWYHQPSTELPVASESCYAWRGSPVAEPDPRRPSVRKLINVR